MWWASKKDLNALNDCCVHLGRCMANIEGRIGQLEKRIAALEPKKPVKSMAEKRKNALEFFNAVSEFSLPKTSKKPEAKKKVKK